MLNLSKISGLPLKFDEKKKAMYLSGEKLKPDIRLLSQMRDVCLDGRKVKGDRKLYFMYRDVARTEAMRKKSLRYDVTVIFPAKIGREYNKTAGHYHPMEYGHISYPEVYEILHGEAHILIEKISKANQVSDNYLIVAEKGDKILIPPNFGHITINTTDGLLIMSNIVDGDFSSDYAPIKKRHGAAYYIIDEAGPTIVKNSHYRKTPVLKELMPKDLPAFGLKKSVPLFEATAKNPNRFEYLIKPHKFVGKFKKVLS